MITSTARAFSTILFIVLLISLTGCDSFPIPFENNIQQTTQQPEVAGEVDTVQDQPDFESYHSLGTVEGSGGWVGPLHYNVTGDAVLGDIAIENDNLHRYDTGKFFGPGTIEVWGDAYNNAHELEGSNEYSYGVMTLWVLVRYEDTNGNIKIIADSRDQENSTEKALPRYSPGVYSYHLTAVIPDDVKQVKGRSSVMIEISNSATWGTGDTRMAANLQFSDE